MSRLTGISAQCRAFFRNDCGAVTVDWIALTAAIALLGIGVGYYVGGGVPMVADTLVSYMEGIEVGSD